MDGGGPGGRCRLRCRDSPFREGRLGGGLGRRYRYLVRGAAPGRTAGCAGPGAGGACPLGDAPCPAPDGGWPATERRGDVELSYDVGDLATTGAATAITLFHPSKNQAVLVVAAADLAAVEAQLRPQLGTSLCVVPSRWTQHELDAVRDHLNQRWQQWNLLQLGPQHDENGQAHIAAGLVRVLPEIAVWAASLPSGIVALEPWLTPVRGDRDTTS